MRAVLFVSCDDTIKKRRRAGEKLFDLKQVTVSILTKSGVSKTGAVSVPLTQIVCVFACQLGKGSFMFSIQAKQC